MDNQLLKMLASSSVYHRLNHSSQPTAHIITDIFPKSGRISTDVQIFFGRLFTKIRSASEIRKH